MSNPHLARRQRFGLTLIELIVVLFILAALAGLVVPAVLNLGQQEVAPKVAEASMAEIRNAIMQYWSDCKYLIESGSVVAPGDANRIYLGDLFENPFGPNGEFDPATGLGWRGPYIANGSRVTGDVLSRYPTFAAEFAPTPLTDGYTRRGAPLYDIAVFNAAGVPYIVQDVFAERDKEGLSPILNSQGTRELRIVSAGVFPGGGDIQIDTLKTAFTDNLPALDPSTDENEQYVTIQLR